MIPIRKITAIDTNARPNFNLLSISLNPIACSTGSTYSSAAFLSSDEKTYQSPLVAANSQPLDINSSVFSLELAPLSNTILYLVSNGSPLSKETNTAPIFF